MTDVAALTAVELKARGQYGLFSVNNALAVGVTRTMLTHSRHGGRWRRYLRELARH